MDFRDWSLREVFKDQSFKKHRSPMHGMSSQRHSVRYRYHRHFREKEHNCSAQLLQRRRRDCSQGGMFDTQDLAEKDMALGDQTRQRVLLVLKSATPAPLFPLYTGASKATKMYNSILDQGCLQREPRAYRSESFPLTKGTVYLFELEGQIV